MVSGSLGPARNQLGLVGLAGWVGVGTREGRGDPKMVAGACGAET